MRVLVAPYSIGSATVNMAGDLALLERTNDGNVWLRHYDWESPAWSFGYSQKVDVVETLAPANIELVRRPTGGGIVDHHSDWTYAIALPRSHPLARKRTTELYSWLHQAIQQWLHSLGTASQLAPCDWLPRTTDDSNCFSNPVAHDVLANNGEKIAGAAMKRTRSGILIQGSILRSALPAGIDLKTAATIALAVVLEKSISAPDPTTAPGHCPTEGNGPPYQ